VTRRPDKAFGAEYYRRFYGRSPVHTAASVSHLASATVHLAAWWGVRIRSVLDVGAGPGYWRDWFATEHPRVRYRSVDVSAYACERFGHEQRDITQWAPSSPFDLVVCQGVLQYLDRDGVGAAVNNLARATGSILYLEVPTLHDREHVIDAASTDLDCYWRSGAWYRTRLTEHFVQIGAGLWARRSAGIPFYELERSR
jgi:hypothetical protein